EGIIEELKQKYFIYANQTLDNPILTFEEYSKKVYELGVLTEELDSKTKELAKIKNEIEELKFSLASEDVDFFINNFQSVLFMVLNEGSLTSEEKLDKLKAYYFTFVRNIEKEFKFLNCLHKAINDGLDSDEGAEAILIDLEAYVKQFYK
ncbi:MAG: hypothetical protein IKE33_00440, partial [Erysipelotrichaceae bacterium]|nr:hypothetical protein [Erysipelotrichaceae bacterium]